MKYNINFENIFFDFNFENIYVINLINNIIEVDIVQFTDTSIRDKFDDVNDFKLNLINNNAAFSTLTNFHKNELAKESIENIKEYVKETSVKDTYLVYSRLEMLLDKLLYNKVNSYSNPYLISIVSDKVYDDAKVIIDNNVTAYQTILRILEDFLDAVFSRTYFVDTKSTITVEDNVITVSTYVTNGFYFIFNDFLIDDVVDKISKYIVKTNKTDDYYNAGMYSLKDANLLAQEIKHIIR